MISKANLKLFSDEISKVFEKNRSLRIFYDLHVNLNSSGSTGIWKVGTGSVKFFYSSNTVQIHF